MKTISVAIFLVAAPSLGAASDWVTVSKAQNGAVLMVDVDSVSTIGKYRGGWFKLIQPQVSALPEGVIPSGSVASDQRVAYVKRLAYAQCGKQRIAVLQAVFYGADDTQLGELPSQTAREAQFLEPIPGTDDDAELRFLCRRQP